MTTLLDLRRGWAAMRRTGHRIAIVLAVPWHLVAAVSVAAEPSPRPPAELFFGASLYGDFDLSPSGRWLAVTVQPPGHRSGLAIYDLHGSEPPREVARFSDIDINRVWWVGDERVVFEMIDLQRGSADQRRDQGLFGVRRDGSDLRQYILMRWWDSPAQGTQASRRLDSTHSLQFVPKRQGAGDPFVVVRGARDPGQPLGDWVLKRLYLDSGRVEALNAAEPVDFNHVWFGADGQPLAGRSLSDGQYILRARRIDGEGKPTRDWPIIARTDALAADWLLHSIDEAGRFYVTEAPGPRGEAVLKRLDPRTGRPEATPLVAVPGFDFRGHLLQEPAPGADPVLGVRVLGEAWTTVWQHPGMAAIQQAIDARLPGRSNRLVCARCRETDRTIVVVSGSDRQPDELWAWRGPAAAPTVWRRIGTSRPGIDPSAMGELGLARMRARDGLEIPLWVTLPAPAALREAAGRPPPAVLLVHGGPWERGRHWSWEPLPQFLASRGYVVLEPEYRGSVGYGAAHYQAGWRQWGQAMQDDLVDAVRWAAERGLVDPARVCIAGSGYGGYATLMGLMRDAEVFRCGAAWTPLTDLDWMLKEGPAYAWNDENVPLFLSRRVADPHRDRELIEKISPLRQVARLKAPLLLAWGEEDGRMPPAQAMALRDALKALGRPPQAVGYAGEGHRWLKPETHLDFARRLETFLDASLHRAPAAAKPR